MKQLSILIIVLICSNCYCQTPECGIVSKGFYYYNANNNDSALYCWKYVYYNFPDTSACYRRAVSNIFNTYKEINEKDSAILWGNIILKSNFNDYDPGWRGITNPYANYHYWTCVDLSFIYDQKSDYDMALHYSYLADTLYEYRSFSATSFEKEEVIIAHDKARFYLIKGDTLSAIWVLVNKAIDTDIIFRLPKAAGLTNINFYSSINKQVLPLIDKFYGKQKFYKRLENALNEIKINSIKVGPENEKVDALTASFILYDKTYKIGTLNCKLNKETWKYEIMNTGFVNGLTEK